MKFRFFQREERQWKSELLKNLVEKQGSFLRKNELELFEYLKSEPSLPELYISIIICVKLIDQIRYLPLEKDERKINTQVLL